MARSGAVDLDAIAWDEVPRHPLPPEAVRTLRYMQDIESHTIIYLRSLLATRAIDDPEVATFLACWLYEETFHGIALARFLEAAGHPAPPRAAAAGPGAAGASGSRRRRRRTVSKAWPDFCAVHMTWGAINELTTLTGYRRLAAVARHPVLSELLERIVLDESRHFFFYYRQAEMRLARPAVARVDASPRGPLLGAGRQRRAAARGAVLPRRLSLRRRGGARRRAQGRRHDPAPAGLRHRATSRSLDGPVRRGEPPLEWRTAWRPRPLSTTAPTRRSPFTRAERDSTTILFGGLHWRLERVLQAVLENGGYRAQVLPVATREDLLTGREVADIGQCCPTSFTTGNLVNFLKKKSGEIGAARGRRRSTSTSPPAPAAPAASASTTRATSWRCATSAWTPSACS